MERFTVLNGLVAPLDRANVDTDQIIPKQFLKSIKRTGLGTNLFDAWRYLGEGEHDKANARPARKEYSSAFVARLVEDKIGIERAAGVGLVGLAFVEVAPSIEEIRPEPRALDRFQELLRDDLVGVDIGSVKRGHKTVQDSESFHQIISTAERRRSARRSPPPRPSPGSRDGSCRRCPGGLRNCGSKSTRSARPARAGPRSCPGTWNSRAPSTRSRRP